MPFDGIFVSNVRCRGDFAGIFEQDARGAHFYLYDLTQPHGRKAVNFVRIARLPPDLREKDVNVEWDDAQEIVGLFIERRLYAAFEVGRDGTHRETADHGRFPDALPAAFKADRSSAG